jgi:membrane associated rhomboid family serine protease
MRAHLSREQVGMSQDPAQSYIEEPRLTFWVSRIMVANAIMLLLLTTVFTAPAFSDILQFQPTLAARRPWTFLTSMFLHGGLMHLGINMLLLFVFGPPVERRMGGRAFISYYIYCGVGAAALALGLSSFLAIPPMVGASGAILGVALAFAFAWPDVELVFTPLPFRLSARSLVLLLAVANLAFAAWTDGGAAHVGYLGGMAAGYLFFRVQSLASRRTEKEPKAVTRRPVMAPIPVRQGTKAAEVRPAMARPEVREEYSSDEVDRVLDKISAFGMQSLTAEERRFLDEVSKRKRKER